MSEEAVELRAGPVRLELEGPDLRGLALDGGQLVQRVYPAFRDADWQTAPVVVHRRQLDRGARAFVVTLEGTARLGQLDLAWSARADGSEDGTVTYALDAEARGWFLSRRLGLCVHLDAAACAGGRAIASGPGGEAERPLGDLISPQPVNGEEYMPMLGPFTTLAVALADRSTVTLGTGETRFALEDQRNWADSSLKAYSSGPVGAMRCAPGDRIRQQVRLDFAPAPNGGGHPRPRQPLRVGSPTSRAVPGVGLGLAEGWSPPGGLSPAHLRIDVGLADDAASRDPDLDGILARTGSPVELAVHGSPEDAARIPLDLDRLPLARVLALERRERSTSSELLRLVRRALGRSCRMGVGTSAHFSEVCRRPPQAGEAEFVCWSAHPQVHSSDDRSVMENLPGLGAQVRTARALAPGLRPIVSVLRLGPEGSADPRASSAFGAAWAVGAFSQLLGAGVHAVTVAGEPGQEGVMAVAAVLMEARCEPLRPVEGVEPGVAALAWGEGEMGVLLANLEPVERTVNLELPGVGLALASPLAPDRCRVGVRREVISHQGRLGLRLGPYESLRLAAPC